MRTFMLIVLAVFSTVSVAEDNNDSGGCTGPDTSSFFESCVLSRQTTELGTRLNQKYKELLRVAPSFSPSAKSALIESQRAWIRYRDKTCDFQQSMLGGINSINWVRCENALTAERLKYLEGL